jgi:hypothetical protein
MRAINLVLLDEPVALDMEAVAQAIRRRHPEVPVDMIGAEAKGPEGKESPLIRCAGELVAVMNIAAPAPVGDSDSDHLWNRAAATWPKASEARNRHRAHIVVATVGEVSPLQQARIVTAVIGGLLDVVPQCCAVLWSEAVVRPAADWKKESRTAFAPYPDYPILLWIGLLPLRTATGGDVITLGLSFFIGREIEYEVGSVALHDVLTNVAGLSAYLIEHGDVIKDGDTIGGSETERITVRDAVSSHIPGMKILRITAARASGP